MSDDNTNSGGDGILSGQGSQDFSDLTGTQATTQQQATQTQESTTQTQQQQGQTAATAQQTQETVTQPAQTATTAQQQQVAAQPDINSIIRSTVESTAQAMAARQPAQTQQQQAPAAMSPEEFDRRYGIVRPNEEMMTRIIGQDPRVAAQTLDQIIQSNLTASVRMAADIVDAKLRELDTRYQPHISSWQAHQQEIANKAAEDRFFKTYPDLANEREVVMEIKDAFLAKVQAKQVHFADENQAFFAVANASRSLIQRIRGGQQGSTQTGQSQQNKQQSSGRQMAAASSAGRTGTGRAAAPTDVVTEVFGADAR